MAGGRFGGVEGAFWVRQGSSPSWRSPETVVHVHLWQRCGNVASVETAIFTMKVTVGNAGSDFSEQIRVGFVL